MRLLVDLDGTICINKYPELGEVLPGTREALTKLKKAGHYITIYTCRLGVELVPNSINRALQVKAIEKFLKENEIPFDEIYEKTGKPIADWYIDDRNIEFKYNWKEIAERLLK